MTGMLRIAKMISFNMDLLVAGKFDSIKITTNPKIYVSTSFIMRLTFIPSSIISPGSSPKFPNSSDFISPDTYYTGHLMQKNQDHENYKIHFLHQLRPPYPGSVCAKAAPGKGG